MVYWVPLDRQVVGANEWGGCHADKLGWQGRQLKWCCCNANVILKFNHAAGWLNGNFFSIIKKPSQMLVLWMRFYLHDTKQSGVFMMSQVNSWQKGPWHSSRFQKSGLGFLILIYSVEFILQWNQCSQLKNVFTFIIQIQCEEDETPFYGGRNTNTQEYF